MRVLFVSGELIGSAVVHQLLKEGCDLKLYIDHPDRKRCLDGIAPKTDDWKKELGWVGKDGLIVFDDVIFEGAQDELRAEGYSVYGGNLKGDNLENDRELFQTILEKYGLSILPSHNFDSAEEAIAFVEDNPRQWVVKQSSHIGMLSYVGQSSDGEDVINILRTYKKLGIDTIHIQEKADGVEVAVGRYFNGTDWVGPIKVNFEHKPLCNDDIGPLTAEMGTLVWYEENEELTLFKETLAKIKGYLQEIDYRGDVDINCIANKSGIWPLEATMRFGTPSTELHCEMQKSPWGELMKAVADGKDYNLEYHKGYGIVVSTMVPPFPFAPEEYAESDNIQTSEGVSVFFKDSMSESDMSHVHFEEIAVTEKNGEKFYTIAGKHGYAMYVTG